MMMNLIERRRRLLEDLFFLDLDRKLILLWKKEASLRAKRTALAEVSGIDNDTILDQLIKIGIDPHTFAAFSLVPLIEVAWADKNLHGGEKEMILRAAEQSGVTEGSIAQKLLMSWLENRPPKKLFSAWMEFTRALCVILDEEQKSVFRNSVVGRARSVCETAGGFLGLGIKISPAEKSVLKELDSAFEKKRS